MRLEIKKRSSIQDIINNSLSFNSLKVIVEKEMGKVSSLDRLTKVDLTDEEYLKNILNVYDIKRGVLGGYKVIYTNIPYKNEKEGLWQYRAYEVILPNDIYDISIFSRIYDIDSLKSLVDSGAIVLDMIPFGVRKNKDNLEDLNNKADELDMMIMPKLTNKNLANALRNYEGITNLFLSTKKSILKDLNEKLEYLKRTTATSIELTKERLFVEEEVLRYCTDKTKTLNN